ncbi:MAG: biotin/lipoyl-binding protein [Deltaproteobacteria bacterium]|jgi:acetyl/propionyl-CoA carboxylase alpha subunit|nr:biotin/lipoyl-binding protein [Deltaproteobacteria bacterium]
MDYKLRIQDAVYHVDAAAPDSTGSIRTVLDGKERSLSVCSVLNNRVNFGIDGRVANIFAVKTDEGTWVWVDGRARLVQDADKVDRRKARARSGVPSEVTPPTPAAVVRVLVESGQKVAKGQGLVVVSAMKMEITLSAPYSGMVRAVNTAVGDQVKPGDILVEIEAHEQGDQNE